MITNKKLNRIIMGLVAASLIFTVLFTYSPAALRIQSGTNKEHKDYATTLFIPDRVMTIDIRMEEASFQKMIDNALDEEYYCCDVIINGVTYYNVGIRPKGNSSLFMIALDDTTDRYSFKLEFDHFTDGQTCMGLDKMALNNVLGDSSYMKEYLAYDMFNTMGVAAPLGAFADIKLNGGDWGLYYAVEGIEESFAERNFGVNYGKLYKPETSQFDLMKNKDAFDSEAIQEMMDNPEMLNMLNRDSFDFAEMENIMGGDKQFFGTGTDLKYVDDEFSSYADILDTEVFKGTKNDYRRLIKSLEKLSTGEDLESCVDIEPVLKYFAVNNMVVSLDSYIGATRHNYYLYEKDGKLSILPWDYNYSFGAFGCSTATSMVNYPIDTPVQGGDLKDRPLLGKLLENDSYQDLYHQYHSDVLKNYFYNGKYELTIRKLDQLIEEYVKKDATAFYTYEEYKAGVENLIELGRLRALSVEGQLNGTVPSTKEGGEANPDALVATDSVDYAALGNSQDLVKNFIPKGEGENQPPFDPSAEVFKNQGDPENIPEAEHIIDADGNPVMRNNMMISLFGDNTEEDNSDGLLVLGSSFILMMLSIYFVRHYNR